VQNTQEFKPDQQILNQKNNMKEQALPSQGTACSR